MMTMPLLLLLMVMMMMMIIIIIITSDTSKNKSEYNYHKLYKASSLNLKIISSKGLAFSSFFGAACLYDQVTFRGCLSAVVRSDSICFLIEWMDENWSLLYKSCPMTYKSCHRWSKINYYSWFLSRGTSWLIKKLMDLHKEGYELLLLKTKQQLNRPCHGFRRHLDE